MIATRACFHVYDCRIAILFEIVVFSTVHRIKCSSSGLWLLGSAGCRTVLVALSVQAYYTDGT